MAEGTIKRVMTDKGFGFIETGPGEDLFFHMSAVQGVRFEDLKTGKAARVVHAGSGTEGTPGRERSSRSEVPQAPLISDKHSDLSALRGQEVRGVLRDTTSTALITPRPARPGSSSALLRSGSR